MSIRITLSYSPTHSLKEYPSQAISQCVHAEQTAVANAALAGEPGLKALALSAAPCGHCRQFLNEMNNGPNMEVYIPDCDPITLSSLLPLAFGPKDLNVTEPFLAHKSVKLRALETPRLIVKGTASNDSSAELALVEALPPNAAETKAIIAAQKSYAPYSGAYAAVTLVMNDGQIFEGIYVENAAFNPALPPLQMALINLDVHGKNKKDIVAAVLAERKLDKTVSHMASTQALLTAVAPQADLFYIPLQLRTASG